MMFKRHAHLWLAFSLASANALIADQNWPQWRGPSRDGMITGPAWPNSLDSLKEVWRIPFGPSYSTPIVMGDRVFTTETVDREREVVTAVNRGTGAVLWQREWLGSMSVPFFAKSNGSWIRATPATDGTNLFVGGMKDVLVCLDVSSGNVTWRFDFPARLKSAPPTFGFVSSPLIEGDSVIVQAGGSVVSLKKTDGSLNWRSLEDGGGMNGSAFSSPLIAEVDGRKELLIQSREQLAGMDPSTGKVFWTQKIEAFRGMNILTPVVAGDILFTSSYGGKTIGWRPDGNKLAEIWSDKAQGNMSTPVVIDGAIYHHLKSERFACYEAATGKEKWVTEKGFGKYCSLVASKDRLLALNERGDLRLLKVNPAKYEPLDERKISTDETWAHLVVCGTELYVRELKSLVRFDWR